MTKQLQPSTAVTAPVEHDPGLAKTKKSSQVAIPPPAARGTPPSDVFGPYPEKNWRVIFVLCATFMTLAVGMGLAAGGIIARSDGYSITAGALVGSASGFAIGAYVTIMLRPPHVVVLAVAGGLGMMALALAIVGVRHYALRAAEVEYVASNANQGSLTANISPIAADDGSQLVWIVALALAALVACLVFAFAAIREALRR